MKNPKQPWRSLETREPSPEYLESIKDEFPKGIGEPTGEGVDRRQFLTLLGASMGVAGAASGCFVRKPVQNIYPYSNRPEDRVPGKPWFYATTLSLAGSVMGLLVESQDGRPTKIEGNPDHPQSGGATNAWAQAAVLGVYDPDRSRQPIQGGKPADWPTWNTFAKTHFDALRAAGGDGLALLIEAVPSPTFNATLQTFQAAYPSARVYRHDLAERKNALDAMKLTGAAGTRPSYRLESADVILALDSDFLGTEGDAVRNLRDFSAGRRLSDEKSSMNRLYAVEANLTVTGAQADNRLRMRSSRIGDFLKAVAAKLFAQGVAVPSGADGVAAALQSGVADARIEKWVAATAKDLATHQGSSLIVVGDRQPPAVHALAAMLNAALGNAGKTVEYVPANLPQAGTLSELAESIKNNGVKTLVVLGGNPVYTAPADLQWPALFASVPTTVHLGLFADETAAKATWHLPASHDLESWGDLVAGEGTASIMQPLIAPLYESKSSLELLAQIAGAASENGYELVQAHWKAQDVGVDFDKHWRRWLNDGVIRKGESPAAPAFEWSTLAEALSALPKGEAGRLELDLIADPSVFDGRFANSPWLQEMPDPITKLTWDNAALMSPATAKDLGVEMGKLTAQGKETPFIEIVSGDRKIEAPAWIQPGLADGSIVLALGYGRGFPGKAAAGSGVNAYALATSAQPFIQEGITVRSTGRTRQMVTTQEHGEMEGRPIIREATFERFREEPKFAKKMVEHPPLKSLWEPPNHREGMQWGMSIDLTACNGCNACLVACQAENNIPTVGRERVGWGREMHWIRLDRYYTGDADEPSVAMQPMMCVQCEMAPCESVCPVGATVHSPEGLNDMAYNRCIGTRYCSNNCPYKVRRFNFFNYNKEPFNQDPETPELSKMQRNPDVTVRFRGVMEKCTYCVQRINEARAAAKREGSNTIPDGAFKTACEQACPARAIVFGNIADPESRVSKRKAEARDYAVLEELNVIPRTTYLAKVRNPNPDLV